MPAVTPEQRAILLVDDQEADVVLIKRALAKSGLNYPVHSVPGGLEALAYLKGDPPFHDRKRYPFPRLVLLDVKMPLMDGFEVLGWIRRNPELANLPVVMLTGSNHHEDATRAHVLGATSFLIKSLDFGTSAALSSTVQRLIAAATQ